MGISKSGYQQKAGLDKEAAAHQQTDLRAAFDRLDLDGNGTLDRQEVSQVSTCKALSVCLSVCLCVCLPVCLSVCLSVCLPPPFH
eukprot:SAG22_NODE_3788_length_1531_cov_1.563547_2_plen_85_part_00